MLWRRCYVGATNARSPQKELPMRVSKLIVTFWIVLNLMSVVAIAEDISCGGIQGKTCPQSMFCDLMPGHCKAVDLGGVCKKRPEVCTEQFLPVCGCDGKTYGNDCARLIAGAQKNHDGKCEAATPSAP